MFEVSSHIFGAPWHKYYLYGGRTWHYPPSGPQVPKVFLNFNDLLGLPETPDLDKIKKHFTETVTEKEFRAALDRLEIWVAKEKASKIKARIQEKKLLKAEKKRLKHIKDLEMYK